MKVKNKVRSHDKLYLSDDRSKDTKYSFLKIIDTIHDFKIDFEELIFPKDFKYKENKDDYLRSWNTIFNNKNLSINVTQIVQHQYLCKIYKK